MIPYIDAQLVRWSAWLHTGRTRLGYPRQAAFVGAMGGGRGSAASLPDDEALAICTAIAALDPQLKATVECYYRSMQSCTGEQIGKHLGCSKRTVYDRIDRAHVCIMGFMNDIAADVPVPPFTAAAALGYAPTAAEKAEYKTA